MLVEDIFGKRYELHKSVMVERTQRYQRYGNHYAITKTNLWRGLNEMNLSGGAGAHVIVNSDLRERPYTISFWRGRLSIGCRTFSAPMTKLLYKWVGLERLF